MNKIVEKLRASGDISDSELKLLIECKSPETAEFLRKNADEVRQLHYGKKVYLRGLIEISSYCKNNCYYC